MPSRTTAAASPRDHPFLPSQSTSGWKTIANTSASRTGIATDRVYANPASSAATTSSSPMIAQATAPAFLIDVTTVGGSGDMFTNSFCSHGDRNVAGATCHQVRLIRDVSEPPRGRHRGARRRRSNRCGVRAGRLPGPTTLGLEHERPGEERPHDDEQAECCDVLERLVEGHRTNDVGGDQEVEKSTVCPSCRRRGPRRRSRACRSTFRPCRASCGSRGSGWSSSSPVAG